MNLDRHVEIGRVDDSYHASPADLARYSRVVDGAKESAVRNRRRDGSQGAVSKVSPVEDQGSGLEDFDLLTGSVGVEDLIDFVQSARRGADQLITDSVDDYDQLPNGVARVVDSPHYLAAQALGVNVNALKVIKRKGGMASRASVVDESFAEFDM